MPPTYSYTSSIQRPLTASRHNPHAQYNHHSIVETSPKPSYSNTNQNTYSPTITTSLVSGPVQSNKPTIEIIQDRLYWISSPRPPSSFEDAYYFNIDDELVYDPFNNDFGPLNLAQTHKFVRELVRMLSDPKFKDFHIFHHCSNRFDK
jgi:Dual specificity protein phosphatase, N-terminal half